MRENEKFSFDDFKRWIKSQDQRQDARPVQKTFLGTWVESKINTKKLMSKMCSESGDVEELALDFKRDGGIVIDVEGKEFIIEVDSGTFTIPRNYVKRKED
jgi:hypothetical protein